MKSFGLALALLLSVNCDTVFAESQALVCRGELVASNGSWYGQQPALEFEIDLRQLRNGFQLRKVVRASDLAEDPSTPGNQAFEGVVEFYVARRDPTERGPIRYYFGILHMPDDQNSSFGEAFAGYAEVPRGVFVKGTSSGHGLTDLTLTCAARRKLQ